MNNEHEKSPSEIALGYACNEKFTRKIALTTEFADGGRVTKSIPAEGSGGAPLIDMLTILATGLQSGIIRSVLAEQVLRK